MNSFNGQINISRDLRQNKQTVLGKYDLTDIMFLVFGVGTAITFAYLVGFLLKITDEFVAIIISLIPMILIISFGFRRVAGIRQFNYTRMKMINKKTRFRLNRINDKTQIGEKYLIGFEIDIKYIGKYIDKFLNYDNLNLLQLRYIKDIAAKDKVHIILDMRYKKQESIMEDVVNKFFLNKEIKALSVEDIYRLDEKISLSHDKYIVYMLNLYDIKILNHFIDKVKIYCDVVCYIKSDAENKYINTFLIINSEISRDNGPSDLDKVEKLCNENSIILNRLTKEQQAGKIAVSYLMNNPFNSYRLYKE